MMRDLWLTVSSPVIERWLSLVCRVRGHDYGRYGPANEPWWYCNRCGVELL